MELRHLRYFLAVADELHFGRAAERLGIAQPPLSRQIRYLEHILNAELFTRTSRKVELTKTGELFVPEAKAILSRAERAQRTVARARRGEIGRLSVGIFPSALFAGPITQTVSTFRVENPHVYLALRERPAHIALAEMARGELDLGFVRYHGPPPAPIGSQSIEIFSERLVVLFHAGHPLADGDGPVALSELAEEPMVLFSDRLGNPLLDHISQLCRQAGFQPIVAQEADQNGTLVGLVAAGMGISILPPTICQMRLPGLRSRPLVPVADGVSSVWLIHSGQTAVTRAFVDLAKRHMRHGDSQDLQVDTIL